MTEQEWLGNNQLSLDIFNKKYRVNNENFDQWLNRVSGGDEDVKQLIREKKFLFGGRILAGRGITGSKKSLSNCYVITPPEDNLESIFETAKKLAKTYSTGGGCGVDVSKLRPKGSITHNAAKESTGPTSFMELYSYVTGLISQQGRRGALLLTLDCSHPDIEEFINLKTKQGVCEKANISIRVSDKFMEAAVMDRDWITEFDSPETGKITKTFKAKDLLMLLAKRNWEWAEPGLVYWDRINSYNMLNLDENFKYGGLNPCCEEPLPSGGSCLLGSINLSEFVVNSFSSEAYIDEESLCNTVHIAIIALNNVLDEGLPLHPLEEQRNSVSNWRQVGLGTFGMADMLIKLGITYGSEEALNKVKEIYKLIAQEAVKESLNLAKKFGAYPMCKDTNKLIYSSFIQHLDLDEETIAGIEEYGLRNSQLLTCAPTGSTATMFSCSTGVEPNFALHYTRKTQSLDGKDTYYEVNVKIVEDYFNAIVGDHEESRNYDLLPSYFVESKDIKPIDRILMQSALQEYTDAAINILVA